MNETVSIILQVAGGMLAGMLLIVILVSGGMVLADRRDRKRRLKEKPVTIGLPPLYPSISMCNECSRHHDSLAHLVATHRAEADDIEANPYGYMSYTRPGGIATAMHRLKEKQKQLTDSADLAEQIMKVQAAKKKPHAYMTTIEWLDKELRRW